MVLFNLLELEKYMFPLPADFLIAGLQLPIERKPHGRFVFVFIESVDDFSVRLTDHDVFKFFRCKIYSDQNDYLGSKATD